MQEAKEPSSTMLYVSNLPFSFENDDLKNVFAGFEVSSAYVATRRNGRSKGFGFVTFTTEAQQAKALESVDGTELAGRPLTVKVAHKDDRRDSRGELKEEFKTETEPRTRRRGGGGGGGGGGSERAPAAEKKPSDTIVYVSNLPFEFGDDDLKALFPKLNVVSARIARRRNDRSKGFGFVEFASNKDQLAALKVDGHAIGDREISVKVSVAGERSDESAAPRERKARSGRATGGGGGGREAQSQEISGTTVYVSNLPFDLTDEGLADLFRAKGHKPTAARIARKRDERSKGFGFVEFASEKAQQAALALDGQTLEDRDISVKVAKKGSETREDGAGAGGEEKRKRAPKAAREPRAPVDKKPSDVLCYVSNLSFDMDDNALAKLFDGLSIKSAHVAVRRNGRSKGFGFVEFASHADQQKALAKSGTELGGRTLTVEVANEKQEEETNN